MLGLFYSSIQLHKKIITDKTVGGSITINESQKFHPEQWVKLYGVFSNRCDYIITCQVCHLETVIGKYQRRWWDTFLLEPVDEAEQPISIEEAFRRCYCTAS